MKTPTGLLFACAALIGATAALAQTRTFTGQYSFGDSLSDNGNLFALSGRRLPPPPYFDGRFSNGPVFTELLGNPLFAGASLPGRGTYVNFAVAGANALLPNEVPTLNQQIGIYRQQGFPPQPNDLFTVLAGANDLIPIIPLGATNPAALDTASGLVAQAVGINVQVLVSLGAKNIVVAGLPNLGATPRSLLSGGPGSAASALGLRASNAFNNELRARLQAISGTAADVNLVYVDLQGILDRVAIDFRALGFSNATSFFLASAAQGGGVGDPNSYVFWDDIHPTTRTHALLAAVIVEQLNPEIPLGFNATLGTAALALEGLAAQSVDQRAAQLAGSNRATRRADVYATFNYADGARARDRWRPKFDYTAQVVTTGVDARLGEGTFVGGAFNLGRLNTKLRRGGGDFRLEDAAGRLYAVWRGGPVSLIADGDYGVLTAKGIHRATAFGGLRTNGKTSGDHWGVGVKAAWAIDFNAISVRPWVGLRTERVSLDAYSEKDIPALSMNFAEQHAKSSSGAVGVDGAYNWKVGGRAVRLDGRAAWHGEFGSRTRNVAGKLADNFTRTTSVAFEDGDGEGLELGGAATLFFSPTWSASLGYAADIRRSEKLASRVTLSVQSGF
jgi:outer membrane lipase/esterase